MFEPIQASAIVAATLFLYSWRADFARYSIFTVGVFKRLDRTVVEGAEYECAELHCEEATDVSERRRYYKEIVVIGMPLLRFDKGESHYCEDHVSFEALEDLDNPQRSTSERLGASLLAGLIAFMEWVADPVPPAEEDDPLEDVTASFGAAIELIPVVMIILLAAVVLSAVERGIPNAE